MPADTLYDADRPFGLPVKTRLLPFDPDPYEADAVSHHEVEVEDPRDFIPRRPEHTYTRRQD